MTSSLFTPDWWDQVLHAWNGSEYRPSLAGFGEASFRVSDMDVEEIWVRWDAGGRAERVSGGDPSAPKFTASCQGWLGFIEGRYTATVGVMRRHLQVEGSFRRVLPYTRAFNNLARVSRPFV